jgi:hypothetical protein
MLRSFVAISALLVGMGSAWAQEGPIAVKIDFKISEKGGFWEKTGKEAGTPEAAAMITAACAAFGVDCSRYALAGTQLINQVVVGDDVKGEEHHGIIRAPVGYEICRVKIDWGNTSITGESTFNTVILRDPQNNGLGYYAVVPKHRKEGHWISAPLYLKFVPAGKVSENGCWPEKLNPWICKGQNCSTFNPEARL